MNDILTDLRLAVEAACAERDRLWVDAFAAFRKEDRDLTEYRRLDGLYCDARKREIEARAALHAAVIAAVGGGPDAIH